MVGAVSDPVRLQPEGGGTTPLTPDEAAQLRPSWILDRGSLNAVEVRAIATVRRDLVRRPPPLTTILDDLWLRWLHIHPFPDGNGRHARLAADACVRASGAPAFTWGATLHDVPMDERRQRYYRALSEADRSGDVTALQAYVRT